MGRRTRQDRREIDPTQTFTDSLLPLSIRYTSELSAGAKWAWLALALNAGKSNSDYPTLRDLSRQIGVGQRRARRYIQ